MDPEVVAARVWAGVIGRRHGFGLVDPWLIAAQAALETGNFTSAIYVENNNLFGLKRPTQRPTTAVGSNRGHAVFLDRRDSVEDYFLRQSYFGIPNTRDVDEYIAATQASGYATATNYRAAWIQRYDTLVEQAAAHFRLVLPALVGANVAAAW